MDSMCGQSGFLWGLIIIVSNCGIHVHTQDVKDICNYDSSSEAYPVTAVHFGVLPSSAMSDTTTCDCTITPLAESISTDVDVIVTVKDSVKHPEDTETGELSGCGPWFRISAAASSFEESIICPDTTSEDVNSPGEKTFPHKLSVTQGDRIKFQLYSRLEDIMDVSVQVQDYGGTYDVICKQRDPPEMDTCPCDLVSESTEDSEKKRKRNIYIGCGILGLCVLSSLLSVLTTRSSEFYQNCRRKCSCKKQDDFGDGMFSTIKVPSDPKTEAEMRKMFKDLHLMLRDDKV